MDKHDFWTAKGRLQAVVKHRVRRQEVIDILEQQTRRSSGQEGGPNRVSGFYDRVVAEIDALTAAIETWE